MTEGREGMMGRRILPTGREAGVYAQIFNAKLVVGEAGSDFIDDMWEYPSVAHALIALDKWDGEGEPEGWTRNPMTGRRRPDGDPGREYVRP